MHPFCPLRVESSIWLLVLRFEHSNSFTLHILDKVAPTRPLVDPSGVHALVYRSLRLADQVSEGGVI